MNAKKGTRRHFVVIGARPEEVNKMWHEVLQDNFLRRPRLSRIYYKEKFFYYPLRPLNAVKGLGLWEGLLKRHRRR
jgi:protoporphyrinogen oxidase